MKTALNSAPYNCKLCNVKLKKPKYKYELVVKPCKQFPNGLVSSSSGQWRVDCKCGAVYIWSFPDIYIRTHRIMELLMYRSPVTGNLIKPLEILL